MLNLIKKNELIKHEIGVLKRNISISRVYLPKNVPKIIFLCGANNKDSMSERRKALMNFAKNHLQHTQFFLAEGMFPILQKEGHKDNILDIEHEISEFADHILIVLESPSSFAELGAFSHEKLRKKLIIINDSKYLTTSSFINLGPLKAIEEASGKKNIISYQMKDDGVHRRDAIGDVYAPLYELLKERIEGKASAIDLDQCNPAKKFDKYSAMFIHDLIYFTGPINHKELIQILIQLFGDEDFKLKQHVAILVAFGTILRNESTFFKSTIGKTFYDYRFDINKLISTFRNYTLKFFPERIYEN